MLLVATCYLLNMFGLSFTHLVILAILALIVIGPEQLPELARTLGRLLNDWKRTTSDLQSSLTNQFRDDYYRQPTHDHQPPHTNEPPSNDEYTSPETHEHVNVGSEYHSSDEKPEETAKTEDTPDPKKAQS